jgi:hypothetical protein
MASVLRFIPVGLYIIVALVSLLMAAKSLFSIRFLPFQEQAAGMSWESVESRLQCLVLSLMKVSGLGFLVVGTLLIFASVATLMSDDHILRYFAPSMSFVFCLGLSFINHQLSVKTSAKTPWKGSLYAAILLLVGIGISIAHP